MRKAIGYSGRYATLSGLVALLAPLATQAGQPVFDQWKVTNGAISMPGCTSGTISGQTVSCVPTVSGNGFLQQEITFNNSGQQGGSSDKYIQTVITDPNAGKVDANGNPVLTAALDVPYSDESFIRLNASSGIASQQRISENTAYGDPNDPNKLTAGFASTSSIRMGWAATGATPNLALVQEFVDQGGALAGDEYSSSFKLNQKQNGTVVTGKDVTIRQDVELGLVGATSANTTDVQSFYVKQLVGDLLTTTGSLALTPTSSTNGGTVAWLPGEDVMVIWIGQQVEVQDPTTGGANLTQFGFEGIRNQTTLDAPGYNPATKLGEATTFATDKTSILSGGAPQAPFDWDTVNSTFGTAPQLPTLP